jgi:hypothetical protein
MSIAYPEYVKIKDNYCCCYLGNTAEYVVQLKLLRPYIEKQLPGIRLYLACRDSFFYLLADEPRSLRTSEMAEFKHLFAYIRELTFKDKHPVLEFMEESQLEIPAIAQPVAKQGGMALICPEGMQPTKCLTSEQLAAVTKHVEKMGYKPVVLGSDTHSVMKIGLRPSGDNKLEYVRMASLVVGVENEYLFLAASRATDTVLVPTGIGTELYKKMFPKNKVQKF